MNFDRERIVSWLGAQKRTSFTVQETARILAVTPQHVTDLIEEGTIVALNVAGSPQNGRKRCFRIPTPGLIEFVSSRSTLGEHAGSTQL